MMSNNNRQLVENATTSNPSTTTSTVGNSLFRGLRSSIEYFVNKSRSVITSSSSRLGINTEQTERGQSSEKVDDWILDSVIGFLRSETWKAPIMSFIDQRSIIFDSNVINEEIEDGLSAVASERLRAYSEYKALVDFMLFSHMEEYGIDPHQFEIACSNPSPLISGRMRYSIFHQVWAAQDYNVFEKMMIKSNVRLQMEVMKLIENKSKLETIEASNSDSRKTDDNSKNSYVIQRADKDVSNHGYGDDDDDLTDEERVIIAEMQRLEMDSPDLILTTNNLEQVNCDENKSHTRNTSLPDLINFEDEENLKELEKWYDEHEDALKLLDTHERGQCFPSDSCGGGVEKGHREEDTVSIMQIEPWMKIQGGVTEKNETISEAQAEPAGERSTEAASSISEIRVQPNDEGSTGNINEPTTLTTLIHGEGTSSATSSSTSWIPDPHTLKERNEFLVEQRDKLVALKRERRERTVNARPNSASRNAAKVVLTSTTNAPVGQRDGGGKQQQLQDVLESGTMRARKAITEKLKKEVIELQDDCD